MRKVNFTPYSVGGQMNFDLLQFMQNANADVFNWLGSALTKNASNKVVKVSGCAVTQDAPPNFSIDAGIVFFQGEFYQIDAFSGTASGAEVPVLKDDFSEFDGNPQMFADGNNYDVLNNRKLKWEFDAAGNGYEDYNKLYYTILDFSMPIGMGGYWWRSLSDIPANWALANGQTLAADIPGPFANQSLPDLKGRALVPGFDGPGATINLGGLVKQGIGETGGAAEHTLSIAEMPSHNHGGGNHTHSYDDERLIGTPGNQNADNGNMGLATANKTTGSSGTIISSQGGDQAHNNLQPYYVAPYIIRIW